MPLVAIRAPATWSLTSRERLQVELALDRCARTLARSLPLHLELVGVDVELVRIAGRYVDNSRAGDHSLPNGDTT
jgi:hypothetical protein